MTCIDCRKLQCPRPVLETRKHIMANPGEAFEVLVDNEVAQANVTRLANKEGYSASAARRGDATIVITLTPAAPGQSTAEIQAHQASATSAANVVYIASDCMGSGSDELGAVLMHNFVITLAQTTPLPATILLVNSGVKLACTGSQVLEALQQLHQAGVEICACGLCLDFFDLKEQLQVGRVSNMLETIETLRDATGVIRP